MAPQRRRLDAELVRRKIARSRESAVEMIKDGRVFVGGFKATKPATIVEPEVSIRVEGGEADEWASRGAHKLLGALEAFDVDLEGLRVLDAGASTGGFTDVCLAKGAREVLAVDVGYGQLLWRLQNDPRVTVLDRTNIRHITVEHTNGLCDAMVGDLSFISLKLTLPAMVEVMREGAVMLPMVKPQFEVGKDRIGASGVVRSHELRAEVVADIARFALKMGLSCRGVVASPLPGPSGNVEYFLWLVKDNGTSSASEHEVLAMIDKAVQEGPQ
ncbi:MAG: TlyA family RNA methyltransferase [Corynebacterium sp.]|nr:TlyA family RNA methyltransferase [Corynebacterium sp.]